MGGEATLRNSWWRCTLACENIRSSLFFPAGDVSRGAPPPETSPSAKSEEKRMFSQARCTPPDSPIPEPYQDAIFHTHIYTWPLESMTGVLPGGN